MALLPRDERIGRLGSMAWGRGSASADDPLFLALAATRTGTWHWDAATGEVAWDTTMEALCGLAPGTFGGTFEAWRDSLHPDERATVLAVVEEAIAEKGSYEFSHRAVWPDGTERWLECRGQVTTDADGTFTGTVGCAVDVTDRMVTERQQEELLDRTRLLADRLDRLQRLSGRLTGATTVDAVGEIILDLLTTPNTADSRGLWLLDDTGHLQLTAFGPESASAAMEAFARIPIDSDLPAAEAFRTRATVWSASAEQAHDRYPGLATVERTADGFFAVPLCVNDECFGVVVDRLRRHPRTRGHRLHRGCRRSRGPDLGPCSPVRGRRTASGRGHRGRRPRASRAQATRVPRRRSPGRPSAATDHRDLMQRVTTAAVPELGDWCALHFVPERRCCARGRRWPTSTPIASSGRSRSASRRPYDPGGGIAAVMRTGRTEFVEEFTPELRQRAIAQSQLDAAEAEAVLDELDLTSMITVPLLTKRRPVGAMQFVSAESGRRYDQADVALAEAVAGRLAEALDACWLADHQRHIAATLQQALLPPALPAIPGIDVAGAVLAGGSAVEVGGDFYDVFALDRRPMGDAHRRRLRHRPRTLPR